MMALATPDQAQRARPLRAWTNAQREALCTSARGLLQAWSTDWSIETDTVQATIVDNEPPPRRPSAEALQRALQSALFGTATHAPSPGAGSPISRQVGAQAWSDWRARVLAWAGVDLVGDIERDKPLPAGSAWSGDLLLRLRWCGLDWTWQLPGEAVARTVPGQVAPSLTLAPRVELGQALAEHALAAQATLAPVTIRLGDLAALSVGDIVTLPHPLDAPLQLSTRDNGVLLCAGWLGQRHGRKALELAPARLSSLSVPT